MTERQTQPPKSLDADERALARALPRLHGRTAPGPDLDASILAAAQAAVHAAKPVHTSIKPRIRWIAPASLAASMVLAVGMAWQLRPLPKLESAQPLIQSEAADTAARMSEPAEYDKPVPTMQSKTAPAQSASPARQRAISQEIDAQEISVPSGDRPVNALSPPALAVPESTAAASPPPAPPAPSAAASPEPAARAGVSPAASSDTADTQNADRGLRARTAVPAPTADTGRNTMPWDAGTAGANKPEIIERAQQAARKAVQSAPAMPVLRTEVRAAADAGFVDDPDDDVPPATVDSPAVRDAWLHRIGELLEQGKREEAKASLAEFRRRYPAAVLPSRLRALEIEP